MNNNGLISRQTAIDKLFEYAESKFQSGEIELANGILKAKCFLESPCNIPTAYNMDKVLEQLEDKVKEYDERIEKRKGPTFFDETERVKQFDERTWGIEIAIEIVKGGGLDGMHIRN